VFDDGIIQQLAPPSDLYERPENAFVAQFIGENNRIESTVSELKGETAIVDYGNGSKGQALAINCGDVGTKTVLSIRPERVQLGQKKRLKRDRCRGQRAHLSWRPYPLPHERYGQRRFRCESCQLSRPHAFECW